MEAVLEGLKTTSELLVARLHLTAKLLLVVAVELFDITTLVTVILAVLVVALRVDLVALDLVVLELLAKEIAGVMALLLEINHAVAEGLVLLVRMQCLVLEQELLEALGRNGLTERITLVAAVAAA